MARESGSPTSSVPPRTPARKRISQTLRQIGERALRVDPRDVQLYEPSEFDLQIAEAYLAGEVTQRGIAEAIGVSPSKVGARLKDAIVCAWISRHVHHHVSHRLGMVDAAMLQRAMAGDTRAADLLYKRYGQMVQRTHHVHQRVGGLDLEKLTDKDLDALVTSTKKEAAREKIIDVEATFPAADSAGAGG